MESSDDDVTGFRCLKCNFSGLPVTNLTNDDDVRRLPQRRPKRSTEIKLVAPHLSL